MKIKHNIFLMLAMTLTSYGATSYPLVATGQVACYNGNGEQIEAPKQGDALYGQDANYLKGAPMNFKDNGDGTVTDLNTGLMWQQTPNDQGTTWPEAKKYCEELTLAGYDDWRMPTLKELFSISNFSTGWPYLDTTFFHLSANGVSKDEQYWGSELYVGETSQGGDDAAFGVNHVTGHIKAYPAGNKARTGGQGGQQGGQGMPPQGMPPQGMQGGQQGGMQGGPQGMQGGQTATQGAQAGTRPQRTQSSTGSQQGGQMQGGQGMPPQGGMQGSQMGGQQGGPQGMQGGQMGGMKGGQSAALTAEQIKTAFTTGDTNGDGKLSEEEFKAATAALRPKQSGQMGGMQGGPQGMQGGMQGGPQGMQGGQKGPQGMQGGQGAPQAGQTATTGQATQGAQAGTRPQRTQSSTGSQQGGQMQGGQIQGGQMQGGQGMPPQGGMQGGQMGGQQGGQKGQGMQGGQQGGQGMAPPPGGQSGARRGNPMQKQVRAVRGEAYGVNKFVDNGDGTITDEATGLMWQKDDNGKGITWLDAIQLAESCTANGYSDWRLPNVKELQSIVDYRYAPSSKGNAPAIDTTFFNCTETVNEAGDADYGYYWTGTSACFQRNKPFYFAWYVAFGRAVNGQGKDTHGAGAVRFDAKMENSAPVEGGEERVFNYVRLVRDAKPTAASEEKK